MSSLAKYLKNSQNYQNSQKIYEKLDNNIPIIESKSFFLENAHYIDTALSKFGRYTSNQLYHSDRINESTYDESFNIHESEAAKGILIML